MTTTDIKDHATSEQRSLGVNIGINNAKDKGTSKNEQSLGTSSINASHSGHDYQATTQATIGDGAVVISDANALATVNRDVNTATNITKNQDIGGLNANLTVDSRLFTEAGRAQIKAEQADLGKNVVVTGKITGAGVGSSTAATVGLVTGDQTFEQAINTLLNPARAAQFVKDHPEMAALLKAYQEKDYDGLVNAKVGLQVLADYLKVDVTVLLNSLGVKGVTNKEIISLDVGLANRKDTVEVLGHEVAHNQGVSFEAISHLVGSSVDLAFDAQTSVMSDVIATYQASLGDGKDPATQAANIKLLSMDNNQLVGAMIAQPKKMEYWGSVGHQSAMSASTYAGGLDPRKAKDLGIDAWANDTKSTNAMSATSLIMGMFGTGDQVNRHLLASNLAKFKLYLDSKVLLVQAIATGDEAKKKEAQEMVAIAEQEAVKAAKDQAKHDLREVISMAHSLEYGSPAYNDFIASQDVKDKLHRAGDAFAHVDNETGKDARTGSTSTPKRYVSFLGHFFDSILHRGAADPDSPVAHPKAFKEMTDTIYDITVSVTGKPNVDKSKFDDAVKKLSDRETGQVLIDNDPKKVDAKATAILHRDILNKGIGSPVDPTTGESSVIVPPDGEYGPLGFDKLKENAVEVTEKIDDFFGVPVEFDNQNTTKSK